MPINMYHHNSKVSRTLLKKSLKSLFAQPSLHSYSASPKSLSYVGTYLPMNIASKSLSLVSKYTSYQKAPAGQQLLTRATRKRPGGIRAGNYVSKRDNKH